MYDSQGYITRQNNPLHRTIIRYADDFVVFCPSKDIALRTVDNLNHALGKRGLELSEAKTKITNTFDGFDFVGFTFRHFILPQYTKNLSPSFFNSGVPTELKPMVTTSVITSKKSVLSISSKLNEIFQAHRGKPVRQLIKVLNPVIRGYANSKRVHSSSRAMRTLDNQLFKLQMAWIRRTHPKKSRSWQVRTYFFHYKNHVVDNRWTFRCPSSKVICQQFIWHASIRHWPPVVGNYSPDDENRDYWKEREIKKFKYRNVDLSSQFDIHLVEIQNLLCPICGQSLISGQSRLHRHHIIPTSQGEKNNPGNLLLLHLPCHYSLHYGSKTERLTFELLDYRKRLRSSAKQTIDPPQD